MFMIKVPRLHVVFTCSFQYSKYSSRSPKSDFFLTLPKFQGQVNMGFTRDK